MRPALPLLLSLCTGLPALGAEPAPAGAPDSPTGEGAASADETSGEDPDSSEEDEVRQVEAEDDVIVVTGLGRDEAAEDAVHRTRVLTAEELERSGAVSAADALELVPGVQVSEGVGGEGIRLQGLEPEHVLILVDGIRLNGRVSGTLDLRRLPASEIEQIEIVEGPAATLYGSDAMGGVVHIRTKRPDGQTSAQVGLTTGRYLSGTRELDESLPRATPIPEVDTLDATGSLSWGHKGLQARLSAGYHTGEATDITPSDPGTAVNAYRQLRLGANVDLEVSPLHHWKANARWTSFRRWGIDALPTGAVLDRTNLTSEWGLMVGPVLDLDDKTRLTIEAGGSGWSDQYRVDQRLSDTQDAYQRTDDLLGQARARLDRTLGARHKVALGIDLLAEQLTADRLDPKTVDRARYAAFLQDRWDVLGDGTLDVQASVRGDVDTRFGSYLSPRLGLKAEPVPEVTLRLSGGRGFRAPDFREMFLIFENVASGYRVEGTEDLRPETSWNLQGGASWQPVPALTLGVGGFHNDLTDLIQADLIDPGGPGEPQRFGYTNVASARTTGVDVEAELSDADIGGLTLMWRGMDTLDRTTGLSLSGRADHQVTANGHLQIPALETTLSLRGTWFGPRTFVQSQGGELVEIQAPSIINADVTAQVRPTDALTVLLGIENLLDAGDTPETLLQTRPRRIFLGIQGRLDSRNPSEEAP
jgi:outer membrane receptor for ferrienterochelin and colicins